MANWEVWLFLSLVLVVPTCIVLLLGLRNRRRYNKQIELKTIPPSERNAMHVQFPSDRELQQYIGKFPPFVLPACVRVCTCPPMRLTGDGLPCVA